jgi:hypothetical protein
MKWCLTFAIMTLCFAIRAIAADAPVTFFPVTRESRLVLSSQLEKGLVTQGQLPEVLQAPAGNYLAKLETPDGVFFVSPDNKMRFGKIGRLQPVEGGIYIPKKLSPKSQAYLFTGSPPKPQRKEMFWRDLYVTEGSGWHIEKLSEATATAPDDWLSRVTEWVERLDKGLWRLKEHSEPIVRWSKPSGSMVSVVLAPASPKDGPDGDYPQVQYCVIVEKDAVKWSMRRLDITKSDRFVTQSLPTS